jgi:hypothetical protein
MVSNYLWTCELEIELSGAIIEIEDDEEEPEVISGF